MTGMRRDVVWVRPGTHLLLAVVALVTIACASATRTGDEAWRAGRWSDAAIAYEAARGESIEPRNADRVLFRLGLVYVDPLSTARDDAKARERLGELVARYPDSPYRAEAQVVLDLLSARDAAERRVVSLQGQVASVASGAEAAAADLKTRDAIIAQLRASLAETRAELARAREALEQLKRIDLQRRP